jgi:hypothetical protein
MNNMATMTPTTAMMMIIIIMIKLTVIMMMMVMKMTIKYSNDDGNDYLKLMMTTMSICFSY